MLSVISTGQTAMAEFLIKQGADVNVTTEVLWSVHAYFQFLQHPEDINKMFDRVKKN